MKFSVKGRMRRRDEAKEAWSDNGGEKEKGEEEEEDGMGRKGEGKGGIRRNTPKKKKSGMRREDRTKWTY